MMTTMIGSTMMMTMVMTISWLASSAVVAIQEVLKEGHKALHRVDHHLVHKAVDQVEAHQVLHHKEDQHQDRVEGRQAVQAGAHLQGQAEVHQAGQIEDHPVQDLQGVQTLEVHKEVVRRRVQPQQERRLQSVSQLVTEEFARLRFKSSQICLILKS